MQTLSYTALRTNLAETMNRVVNNHEAILIQRSNTEPVVMISLADFESYEETAYLLKSPKNRERLLESMNEVEALIQAKQKNA
jgi:antitoxin YefM